MATQASPFERRDDEQFERALQKLPPMEHRPLVGVPDLLEVGKVLPVLPELTFPVNSLGELIDRLGGASVRLDIEGVAVDPLRMIKYMPAYYFPIASLENFVEKLADLIRANRKQVDVSAELRRIKDQVPDLSFPIESRAALRRQVGRGPVRFQRDEVDVDQVIEHVPEKAFPLRSEEEFDGLVGALMVTRPLIVGD